MVDVDVGWVGDQGEGRYQPYLHDGLGLRTTDGNGASQR